MKDGTEVAIKALIPSCCFPEVLVPPLFHFSAPFFFLLVKNCGNERSYKCLMKEALKMRIGSNGSFRAENDNIKCAFFLGGRTNKNI